jgi:hypothetical protein
MKSKDGFVQAYNAQIVVDAEAQIIVAHDVTQSGSDCAQLLPMTDAVEANLGRKPEQMSADAGYSSLRKSCRARGARHRCLCGGRPGEGRGRRRGGRPCGGEDRPTDAP